MCFFIRFNRLGHFECLLILDDALLYLDQRVASQFAIALMIGFRLDGAIGPCDPWHEGCCVGIRIFPLDIAVYPSSVFLQAKPSVVVDVGCYESAADFFSRLASELL